MKKTVLKLFAIAALMIASFAVSEVKAAPVFTQLTVSPPGVLYPAFDPNIHSYIAYVPTGTETITFTGVLEEWAEHWYFISGDGQKTLTSGDNVFNISWSDKESGRVIETYTIRVILYSPDVQGDYTIEHKSLGMNYSSVVFIDGYPWLVNYVMEYTLKVGNYTGNLPLFFFWDGTIKNSVIENVLANSKYSIVLEYEFYKTHHINEKTSNAPFLAQAGENIPAIKEYPVVRDINKITSFTVTYAGATEMVSPRKEAITVSPNPATDFITISGLQANKTLSFYDFNGRLLFVRTATQASETVDVKHLSSGLYFVKTGNGTALKWLKK